MAGTVRGFSRTLGLYVSAATKVVLFTYFSLVKTTFQLLDCVALPDYHGEYIFTAATVKYATASSVQRPRLILS